MARYKFIAQCNAVAGRERDFNTWYDTQHLPDMLKIPGFISAERFTLAGQGPFGFLAIYELETDDLAGTMAEIGKRAGTAAMPISDAIDGANAQMTVWQAYEPKHR